MNLERARFRRFPGPFLLGLFVFGALLLLNLAVKRGSAADFYLYAGSAEACHPSVRALFGAPAFRRTAAYALRWFDRSAPTFFSNTL